jgi:hypothetical protein
MSIWSSVLVYSGRSVDWICWLICRGSTGWSVRSGAKISSHGWNRDEKPKLLRARVESRVARWFVFKPKIPIWVNFGRSCYIKSWYIFWPFCLFYGRWKYSMSIWCILWLFGIFSPFLVFCTKKNLVTLASTRLSLSCVWIFWFSKKKFGRRLAGFWKKINIYYDDIFCARL